MFLGKRSSNRLAKQDQKPRRFKLLLESLEDRCVPAGIVAVGADVLNPPRVQVYDAQTQALKFDFLAFNKDFRGGVNVAVGDINGDGTPDFVAAVASDSVSRVRAFDGLTGQQLPGAIGSFQAFGNGFYGGVNVATGDVNGDGYADIITGAGAGSVPRVKVFSGADGSVLANFIALASTFRGGVRVAAGDFRNQLATDIVVAAGSGANPRVKVFAGDTQAVLASYNAFNVNFTGGVYLGTGDINHDGTIDVIAGSGRGGRGVVKVFSGLTNTLITQFSADKSTYTGSVRVDAVDANGDTFEDILVGLDSNQKSVVKIFDGISGQVTQNYATLSQSYYGGATVAGSVPRGRGTNYQLADSVTHEIPVLERLAQYLPDDPSDLASTKGRFVPVTAGSIDGDKNVYYISHGWAPGYRDWVNKYIDTHVLKWWETAGYNNTAYPAPSPNPGPDSTWLYSGYSYPPSGDDTITISPEGGLAAQILKADPKAVVIAYSWIDDSATTSALSNAIPLQAYLSEALTNINGLRLAEAVKESLGAGFTGKIHLMGHSHGSKVVTVAAVALEQAGGHMADQLTIFDSPESQLTDELNATNYLWNFIPQLTISKTPGQGAFVDNYFSAFGVNYSLMEIGNDKPMGSVVDTQLFAYPYSSTFLSDPGDWHAYPPAWYAQANNQPATDGYTNGGFAWSPLLGNTPPADGKTWEQDWSILHPSTETQSNLTNPWIPLSPGVTFDSLTITDLSKNPPAPVTTITLGYGAGQTQTFKGNYSKNNHWSGFSFDYLFTGTERGILKIQINSFLAYYVDSQYLTPGKTQHVTLNVAYPTVTAKSIVATLLQPEGVNSTPQVTLSNFKQFDVSYF